MVQMSVHDPELWQRIVDSMGINVKVDPEKVRTLFSGWDNMRADNCGAPCKNGKPCGVWVHKGEKCWRHR